ncbi:MAG: HAD family hydrolase [Candidatus Methanomethylicia archaeon]|nr:HAD family hydrolase [Candidatus Methanomethylicia archaeon]MCQ5373842.1 HAD family hydrolase [Candidatus Methanomethylicia archaeon]
MISAVLFDLDGTILNCVEPMSREFIKIVQKLGVNITDDIRKRVGSKLGEILIERSSPLAEFLLLWRLGRTIGLSFFKRVIMIFLSYSRLKNIANNSLLFEGVIEILHALKKRGLKLAVVTTRSRKDVLLIMKKFSLENFFDVIVTRDDVFLGKPSPEPVILALKKLNVSANEAVVVGDMPTDIESGKQAGTKTIALLTGLFNESLLEASPDLTINSILEVPEALEKF